MVSTHVKNISQNGNLPQTGVKIKNVWNHHLENVTHPKESSHIRISPCCLEETPTLGYHFQVPFVVQVFFCGWQHPPCDLDVPQRVFTNHFRYLKWRNPHRDISCFFQAYVREFPHPPKQPAIRFRIPPFRYLKLLGMYPSITLSDLSTHLGVSNCNV